MIHVHWSDEDNQHVATSDQHPSLSWLDDTPEGAALGLDKLITDITEERA